MKLITNVITLSLGAILLLSGCGGASDGSTQGDQGPETKTSLEARNLQPYASHLKQYYGNCTYSDGSGVPVMIDVDNALNDFVVFIHYTSPFGHEVFNAFNSAGSIDHIEYGGGGTLNPNPTWKFALSSDKKLYQGSMNQGTIFECTLNMALDAETEEGLRDVVAAHS